MPSRNNDRVSAVHICRLYAFATIYSWPNQNVHDYHCLIVSLPSENSCIEMIFLIFLWIKEKRKRKKKWTVCKWSISFHRKSVDQGISSWGWNLDGQHSTYHALFPRAWTIYDGKVPYSCPVNVHWLIMQLIIILSLTHRWARSRTQNILSADITIYSSQL